MAPLLKDPSAVLVASWWTTTSLWVMHTGLHCLVQWSPTRGAIPSGHMEICRVLLGCHSDWGELLAWATDGKCPVMYGALLHGEELTRPDASSACPGRNPACLPCQLRFCLSLCSHVLFPLPGLPHLQNQKVSCQGALEHIVIEVVLENNDCNDHVPKVAFLHGFLFVLLCRSFQSLLFHDFLILSHIWPFFFLFLDLNIYLYFLQPVFVWIYPYAYHFFALHFLHVRPSFWDYRVSF